MGRRLGKVKLEKFKKAFMQEKQRLLESLHRNSQELDVEGDEIDVVQGIFLNDMQSKISSRDVNKINKIDDAIRRIDEGTFGVCEECEKQIPEKRLLAMPACVVCVGCAEKMENLTRQYVG